MLLVLIAVAIATTLSLSFLNAQSTTAGITQNINSKTTARSIAETSLHVAINYVLTDENWRTAKSNGVWVNAQAFQGGTITITGVDGYDEDGDGVIDGDGDLANNSTDPVTLTVVATYKGVQHSVSAVVTPGSVAYQPGLIADHFTANNPGVVSDVNWSATPAFSQIVATVNRPRDNNNPGWTGGPSDHFGVWFRGKILIPTTGSWTFYTDSDDGSLLWINGTQVVGNDGLHSMQLRSGSIQLAAGYHDFEIKVFERTGQFGIIASWMGPGINSRQVIPASALWHVPEGAAEEQQGSVSHGLAVNATIELWGFNVNQAFIDSYDPSAGNYGGANIQANALITTNSSNSSAIKIDKIKINGTVKAKTNNLGLLTTIISLFNSVTITGGLGAITDAVAMPTITLPAGLPASSGAYNLNSGSATLNANQRWSSINMSGNNTVLNVSGNVAVRVDGDVNVNTAAKINIPAGSSLSLYVYGNVNIHNDAQLNFTATDPSRLKIYMMGSNKKVTMTDKVRVVAHIQNPTGSMELWGSGGNNQQSEFFGTYIGNEFKMGDRTRVHLAIGLGGGGGGGGGGGDGESQPGELSVRWIERK